MYKKLFLSIFLFLNITVITSQNLKNFSKDPQKTVAEVKELFKTNDKETKEKSDKFCVAFELYWISPSISAFQKDNFIRIANLMLNKKMRPYPHFENYINTFMAFTKSSQDEISFKMWIKSLESVVDKTIAKYSDYIEDCSELLVNGNINKSNQSIWYSTAKKYRFDFDSIPKIIFEKGDLIGKAYSDSTVIIGTKVIYYPTNSLAQLTGGKITWERVNLDPAKVYVEIIKSNITLRKPTIEADSVLYYNSNYFTKPIKGRFIDKATLRATEDNATYPRFISYGKNITLNNYFPNIDFEGGIEMRGMKFIGSGDENNDAKLVFKRNGKQFITIGSQEIYLKKDFVSSSYCRVVILIDNDTISHPAISFRFDEKAKQLILMRLNEGISKGPFFNTYHKMDMYFEALYWKTDEAFFDFKMLPGPGDVSEAIFESEDFFDAQRLNSVKGYNDKNPVLKLNKFFNDRKTNVAKLSDLVKYYGYSVEDVKSFVFQLAILGFLEYNVDNSNVTVKPRLRNFILSEQKKKDYDIIRFVSKVKGKENARLSLLNYDLQINGIDAIFLSDSQIVNIYPAYGKITLKKNRSFEFSGKIEAGLFDFYAKKCDFNYTNFKLDMTVIDSISFFVENKKGVISREGEYPLVRVGSSIEDVKGVLEIDEPNNKSGAKSFPEYPKFSSTTQGLVYYNKPHIYNGAYKKEKFYYKVNPFNIIQLDDFNTDDIEFNGYLVSAGIFNDITKPLKVRPDYSLGFVHNTDESGMSIYGDKGTFYNTIDLSNKGLRGFGTLKYLTSTSTTNNMVFFPDSAKGVFDEHTIQEQEAGIQYPTVRGRNLTVNWKPYSDKMLIESIEKPLKIFKDEHLVGNIEITPNGTFASGKIDFANAQLESKRLKLLHHEIKADTSNFRLKSYDYDDLAIKTNNYNAHIDFEKRTGNFVSNGTASLLEFPINQYITHCKNFFWNMNSDEISVVYDDPFKNIETNVNPIRKLIEMVSTGNELISVHPAQDSLAFCASKAIYNLKQYVIKTEGVRYIRVADAAIFPNEGRVNIYKAAELETFNNCRILANVNSKYHEIIDATVNIGSRKWYSGVGTYNYIDEDKKVQKILFDSIFVDKFLKTIATGKLVKETGFTLSSHFGFFGDVVLTAENELLNFSGGVTLLHGCNSIEPVALRFKADINPIEIIIPTDEKSKDINGKRISNSIAASAEGKIYSAFATSKYSMSDLEIISAFGYLTFDKWLNAYKIASPEKTVDSNLFGNIITLNVKNCVSTGDGQLQIGAKLGAIEMLNFGIIKNYMLADSATIDVASTINFLFSEELLKKLSDLIQGSLNLEGVDVTDNTKYHQAIIKILGNEDGEKAVSELKKDFRFKKVPSKLQNTFFLSDIQFKWDAESKSFISYNDIGIAMLGKNQVNKYVKGIIHINKKNKTRDELNMYFKIDETEFLFQFKTNVMTIYSSDKDFMKILIETKGEDRRTKSDKEKPSFEYRPGTKNNLKSFKSKFGIVDDETNK